LSGEATPAPVTVLLFVGVFELVRRGRLRERYALLWLAAALVLLVLSAWHGLLFKVSKAVGIYYPPSAFFVIAFAFVLLLLLHFSVTVSRLADQTRVLAQRLALLEQRANVAEVAGEAMRAGMARPAGFSQRRAGRPEHAPETPAQ
jgi:hypothetical protein